MEHESDILLLLLLQVGTQGIKDALRYLAAQAKNIQAAADSSIFRVEVCTVPSEGQRLACIRPS